MEYVGVCYDSGGWGGDLTGLLVGRFEDGWRVMGSHISSSSSYSEHDIRGHFDRRPEELRSDEDTYEWLGQLDQAEMEQLARQLRRAGYRVVAAEEGADVYILNTCTLTHVADRKSRHLLRLARRRNPQARLVATGCYAERMPRELEKIEGVALVAGKSGTSAQQPPLVAVVSKVPISFAIFIVSSLSNPIRGLRTGIFIALSMT